MTNRTGENLGDRSRAERFARFGSSALNAISFSRSGAFTLGAGTCLRIDPDAGFGIAILSNGEPTGVPEALAQIFFKSLSGEAPPAGCGHASVLANGAGPGDDEPGTGLGVIDRAN